MLKTLFPAVLAAVLALALPAAGRGAVVSFNGDDTLSPLYNRTTTTGALSAYSVHYTAIPFFVTVGGAYDFSLISTVPPADFDTFLHLYQGAFDPADAQTNFLAANDDRVFGSPDAGSGLTGIVLAAGTQYYYVADGFLPADYGSFFGTISGPGSVSLSVVPEPAACVPLALAALGGGLVLARRARRAAPIR